MILLHSYNLDSRNPLVLMWLAFWLWCPDKCRRLFLLASLFSRLTNCGENDLAALGALNRHMKLSHDVNSLRFPMFVSKRIWGNIVKLDKIDLDRGGYHRPNWANTHERTIPPARENYIGRLMCRTPCWLRYGEEDEEQMRRDLEKLVDYVHHCPQCA